MNNKYISLGFGLRLACMIFAHSLFFFYSTKFVLVLVLAVVQQSTKGSVEQIAIFLLCLFTIDEWHP